MDEAGSPTSSTHEEEGSEMLDNGAPCVLLSASYVESAVRSILVLAGKSELGDEYIELLQVGDVDLGVKRVSS